MATTDLHVVSAPAPVSAPAGRRWAASAPAAAVGIGAVVGVAAAWLVVATQGLEMTMRSVGL